MELCPSTERFVDGRCWALAELMLKSIPFNSENPALTLSSCLAITAAIDACDFLGDPLVDLTKLTCNVCSPLLGISSRLICLTTQLFDSRLKLRQLSVMLQNLSLTGIRQDGGSDRTTACSPWVMQLQNVTACCILAWLMHCTSSNSGKRSG